MKSKLVMLILGGAMAFSASAPSAMAKSGSGTLPPVYRGSAVSTASAVAKKATAAASRQATASKKYSPKAAVPPHTILNGASHNPF